MYCVWNCNCYPLYFSKDLFIHIVNYPFFTYNKIQTIIHFPQGQEKYSEWKRRLRRHPSHQQHQRCSRQPCRYGSQPGHQQQPCRYGSEPGQAGGRLGKPPAGGQRHTPYCGGVLPGPAARTQRRV